MHEVGSIPGPSDGYTGDDAGFGIAEDKDLK